MHYSLEPCSSCGPCRMVFPSLSRMVTQNHAKMAVHSALQRVLMLRRLLVKVGMTWPRRECPAGSVSRSMVAAADEWWHYPVAISMEIVGANWLISMTDAEDMK